MVYGAICLTKTQESRDLWVRRVAGAYAEEELRIFKFRVKGGVAGCWLAAERLGLPGHLHMRVTTDVELLLGF